MIALIVLVIGSVNASALLLAGIAPAVVAAARGCCAGARPARRGARRVGPDSRVLVARRVGVVGRRAAHAGRVRVAGAAAHRERADGRERVDAERCAARARELVLLRPGPGRLLDRPGRRLRERPPRGLPQLPRPGARRCSRACSCAGSHRAYFALLVVVGTVVAVGAWPYDDPTPYGRVWKRGREQLVADPRRCATHRASSRSSCSASPALLAAAVGIAAPARRGCSPRWSSASSRSPRSHRSGSTGYLSAGLERPEDIPQYWTDADRRSCSAGATRHGCSRSRGRASPRTAGGTRSSRSRRALIDRPYVAREVLTVRDAAVGRTCSTRSTAASNSARSNRRRSRRSRASSTSARSSCVPTSRTTGRARRARGRCGRCSPTRSPRGPGGAAGVRRTRRERRPAGFRDDRLRARRATAADPPPVACSTSHGTAPIVHTAPEDGTGRARGRRRRHRRRRRRPGCSTAGSSLLELAGDRRRDARQLARPRRGARAHRLEPPPVPQLLLVDPRHRGRDGTGRADDDRPQRLRVPARRLPRRLPTRRARSSSSAADGRRDRRRRVGPARGPRGARVRRRRAHLMAGRRRRPDAATHHRAAARPARRAPARSTLVQPLDGPRDRVLTKVRLRFDDGSTVDADLGPASLHRRAARPCGSRPARSARVEIDIAATSKPPVRPRLRERGRVRRGPHRWGAGRGDGPATGGPRPARSGATRTGTASTSC